MRAREEKYKSRIRVLEALASGTNGQTQVNSSATNGKAHVKFGDGDLNMSSSLQLKPSNMNNQSPFLYSFLYCFSGCCRSCAPVEGLFFLLKTGCLFRLLSFAYSLIEFCYLLSNFSFDLNCGCVLSILIKVALLLVYTKALPLFVPGI